MLKVELIDNFEDFKTIEREWNELLAESDLDIPLMRHEWFAAYWQSVGGTGRMQVALVRDSGRLAGIVPLMRKRERFKGLPAAALIFIGEPHYLRTGIIFAGDGGRIIESIIAHLKHASPHDVLIFNLVEKDGATGRALREAIARRKLRSCEIPSDRSPYITIEGSWNDYFKNRSKNFKHKINRTRNLFDRNAHEIRHYTSRGLDEALNDLAAISPNTWKFKEGTAIVSDPGKLRFYRALARIAAERGWLSLRVLRIGGEPAAFAFNLVYKNRVYALQIEYDEKFAAMSPSEFLNTHAIRESFDGGLAEYDWLGRDLAFKMKWTSKVREHVKYIVFNDTAYGSLLYFWRTSVIEPARALLVNKRRFQHIEGPALF